MVGISSHLFTHSLPEMLSGWGAGNPAPQVSVCPWGSGEISRTFYLLLPTLPFPPSFLPLRGLQRHPLEVSINWETHTSLFSQGHGLQCSDSSGPVLPSCFQTRELPSSPEAELAPEHPGDLEREIAVPQELDGEMA